MSKQKYISARLNDNYFHEDILEYLKLLRYDDPEKQEVVNDLFSWCFRYDIGLISSQNTLLNTFRKSFPKCVIKLDPCEDGNSTFMIKIYGQPDLDLMTDLNIAHSIIEKIELEFPDYWIIPSFVSSENTEKYYPEIWKEVLILREKK